MFLAHKLDPNSILPIDIRRIKSITVDINAESIDTSIHTQSNTNVLPDVAADGDNLKDEEIIIRLRNNQYVDLGKHNTLKTIEYNGVNDYGNVLVTYCYTSNKNTTNFEKATSDSIEENKDLKLED